MHICNNVIGTHGAVEGSREVRYTLFESEVEELFGFNAFAQCLRLGLSHA